MIDPQLDDYSLVISEDGNALKAELDDPSNTSVMDIHVVGMPVAGNMQSQDASNNPIESLIGEIMGVFKALSDSLGGIL